MDPATTQQKKDNEPIEINDSDSSPDSTPLALGRSLPSISNRDTNRVENAANEGASVVSTSLSQEMAKEKETGQQEPEKETPVNKEEKDVVQRPPPSKSVILAEQIHALIALRSRIAALRNLPSRLLTLDPSHDPFDTGNRRDSK